MINQNLKNYILLFFFLAELTVSTLLIILQSLLASYQLLLYKKSLLLQYCYGLPHILLTDRAINTHTYPIFLFFLFCFMVQSSRAIDKNEVRLMTTYHLLQWLSQYTSRVFGKILFSFSAKPK